MLISCAFALAALGVLGWYVTTDSFQRRMRSKVVAALESATGGRVDLGELHTIPFRLRVDVRNLTIHGREAADQQPFAHVERVQAQLKIISLLSTTFGLHSLEMEHPVLHIIDYPDGTTNIPTPPTRHSTFRWFGRSSQEGPVERLISLSVSQIEIKNGELLWQDEKVPFSFAARELELLLSRSLLRQRYEGRILVGSVDTHWQRYPAFAWSTAAAFVLTRGRADISTLTVRSGKSEVQFTGRLESFHDPKIIGEYRGEADLAEMAGTLRQRELHKGTAQFSGKGNWSLRDFSTEGKLEAKDVDWSAPKLTLRGGRAEAVYKINPIRLQLSAIKANLLGGELLGDVDVSNWQNSLDTSASQLKATAQVKAYPQPKASAQVSRRVASSSQQRGSAHLRLADFPVTPVLDFLSTKSLPLDRLSFVANASGAVEMAWLGSIADAETKLKISLAAPLRSMPAGTVVHGQIDGIYRGSRDELELNTLHLASSASDLTASGKLSANSSLHFTLTSHNVAEWNPLIEAAYGSSPLPFAVHGWASLNGTASGALSTPAMNGRLEVYDFDTTLPGVPQANVRAVPIHWDALVTSVQYSQTGFAAHNGSLIHGSMVAHFDVSQGLIKGALTESAPFTLHLDLLDAGVGELRQWAGLNKPVTGKLALSVNMSGTLSHPHGEGHFEVRDGTVYGGKLSSFRGDMQLADRDLQLSNLDARAYNATFSGRADFNALTHEVRLNAEGKNIDLAHFPDFHSGRISVDGIAEFAVQVSGTLTTPAIQAHVLVKNLALDQEHMGDFHLEASTQGRRLDVKGYSDFEASSFKATGNIDLENDFTADLNLEFERLNVVSLLNAWLPGRLTGSAPVGGTIVVRGPLRTPRELLASGNVKFFSAEVEHVPVSAVEPIRFEIAKQTVLIESLHLAGSGTDFTAHGTAHFAGAQEMDLQFDGSANMALLESMSPKILARGTLNAHVTAMGSLEQPVLQGRLELKNTFLSHNDFPSGLSDLNGVLLFDRNRVQIEKLQGTTGGGTIALTGSGSYEDGVAQFDLGADAHGVRLRYPAGVSSTADATVRLTGTSKSAVFSGNVLVTKLAVTPGFDFGAYVSSSRQEGVLTRPDSLESRLRLDVHVATTPELQMQTAIARLSGSADLRVRGTADRPVILGRAEVLEGDISFNGTKYHLERGDVTFANPAKTQPIVDLQASTRVQDYDITVRIRGDATAPNGLKISWQSEPSLPEGDVVALLALGRTQEQAAVASQSGAGNGFSNEASSLLLNEALNSTVNSRMMRLFGVSHIKIDPQGSASETNIVRGPQLTVEQQVASNITVTYSTNVSVSSQQIIQAEYNITRNISIVALRDQNGVVSFDLRIRTRRK